MFKEYLYTYFFGYAAFKWRRLIRTLLILPILASAIAGIFIPVLGYNDGFYIGLFIYLGIISFLLVLGLISWLIKPFVVEESSEIASKKSTKDVVIKNEKPSKKYSINEYLRIPLLVIIYSFLFFIQFAIALYAQMEITGRETGSIILAGTVFALILSYRVCKFINKKLKIKPINN